MTYRVYILAGFLVQGRRKMCLGQCEPFVLSGPEAVTFDRGLLKEYNKDLNGILVIEDTGDKIVVSFPADMDERDKNNAHLILEESFGFN